MSNESLRLQAMSAMGALESTETSRWLHLTLPPYADTMSEIGDLHGPQTDDSRAET